MTRPFVALSLLAASLALGAACAHPRSPSPTVTRPATVADAVLAADRRFAGSAAPLPQTIGAMLADEARMPAPRGEILVGRDRIVAALAATADSTARAHWTPVQVGLAADGLHAFTVGFLTATRADGTRVAYKYLTFWTNSANGWRAAAWRRRPMDNAAIDSTPLPPLLPPRLVGSVIEAPRRASHIAELRAAEAEFSALANRIGVGAAFAQRGTPESLNAGRPSDGRFIRGADAIAQVVAGGTAPDAPSTITWSADTAIVATSNDLGITFGVIRPKQSPATGTSFFTIWRKSNGVWRYVAE